MLNIDAKGILKNTGRETMNIYFDLSLRGIRFQILDKMSLFDKDYLSSLWDNAIYTEDANGKYNRKEHHLLCL